MTTIRRSARKEFTIDAFALLIGKCDPVRNFLERTKATDAHLGRLIQCANVDAGRIRLVALNHLKLVNRRSGRLSQRPVSNQSMQRIETVS